ncbi:Fur family transcriptional regulator [Carboxydothermus islandicus]|uniref:Fur family transcriptional regulator n=1 Tax=Carboxydothermus islandicus TaxID=661089 RepID=UPI00096A5697|nr:Fur family transcriptional regulator [Carboxydothermus islandicus]
MESILSQVGKKLRESDYKLTPQREEILRVLIENQDKHLSAEEILGLVKEKSPEIGLATVYRTLEILYSLGLVHCMDFGDGRKRYEFELLESKSHQHHHLICLNCGKIEEIEEDLLEELEREVYKNKGFVVTNHQLKIYGFCRNCAPKKEGEI